MNKLKNSILKKIEKEAITPRPKWQFVTAHVLLWTAFVFSIVLGSMATGLMLRHMMTTEWGFLPHIGPRGFLFALPYVWLIALAGVLALAYFVFIHTKKGYKMRPWWIVIASIAISLIAGSVLYAARVADFVEDRMREHVAPYKAWQQVRDKEWVAPERGVLGGRIDDIEDETHFTLEDIEGDEWEVTIREDYEWKRPPREGMPVLLKGEKTGEFEFEADHVRVGKRDFEHRKPPRGKRLPKRAPRR